MRHRACPEKMHCLMRRDGLKTVNIPTMSEKSESGEALAHSEESDNASQGVDFGII